MTVSVNRHVSSKLNVGRGTGSPNIQNRTYQTFADART